MNDPVVNARPQDSHPPEILGLDRIVAILWESAVQSFIRAILVVVFGSIAISMASGIWQEMAPSRPPGFEQRPKAEATSPSPLPGWETRFSEHRFLIIFVLIFVLTLWFRLVGRKLDPEESKTMSHLGKITNNLSENWFGLIVGNALGALISAVVLVWVQRFTFASLLFHWLLESVLASLQNLAQHLLGTGRTNAAQAWFSWYGDNQLRFTFWFFYLSAICDDLGIPNFKTLGRRLGRKLLNRIKHQEAL
jgi:hypothetical protein